MPIDFASAFWGRGGGLGELVVEFRVLQCWGS